MFNSAILEVIIGMIFVYSLVAILVTQINTVIANLLKLRAQHLKHAVQQIVTDPTTQARLLTHPLINLVPRPLDPNRAMSAQFADKIANESGTTSISWIDPATFSQVLLDIVAAQSGASKDIYGPLQNIANTVLVGAEKAQIGSLLRKVQLTGNGVDDLQAAILNLADPADQQALLQAFDAADATTTEFGTDSPALIAIRRGILNIENPDFKRAFDTILSGVHSIEEAEKRVNTLIEQAKATADKAKAAARGNARAFSPSGTSRRTAEVDHPWASVPRVPSGSEIPGSSQQLLIVQPRSPARRSGP